MQPPHAPSRRGAPAIAMVACAALTLAACKGDAPEPTPTPPPAGVETFRARAADLDFSAVPEPFDLGVSAAVGLADGATLLFVDEFVLRYEPLTKKSAPVGALDQTIDAALRWNDETILVTSGAEAFLLDAQEMSTEASFPLGVLGVPDDWDRLDAAALYDEAHWILVRGDAYLFASLPTAERASEVTGPYPLASLGLEGWGSVDAAAALPGGRVGFFGGDGVAVLAVADGVLAAPRPLGTGAVPTLTPAISPLAQ